MNRSSGGCCSSCTAPTSPSATAASRPGRRGTSAIFGGPRFHAIIGSLGGGGGGDVDRISTYTTDGVHDTTFGGDGVIDVPTTLAVDESGDIVNGRLLAVTAHGGVALLVIADDFDAPEY